MAKSGIDNNVSAESRHETVDDEFTNTYSLEWLFDPNNFDHLSVEDQLKLYKQRDLKRVKLYKWAARVWGKPPTRKRVIEAPPMYTSWQESSLPVKIDRPPMNSQLKPQQSVVPPPTEEENCDDVDLLEYKAWMKKRRNFRDKLEMMGLNEDWLARKPNKTPLEQRVLRRMMEEKYPRVPTPPVQEQMHAQPRLPETSPVVRRPCPLAIRILEKFLQEKKIRLIDLFASVDKDKNWKVSREEFRHAITKAEIPITDVLLEDLILALDTDFNDELDYRELAKGMVLWKIEKRETKRRLLASDETTNSIARYSKLHGLESPLKESDETENTTANKSKLSDTVSSTSRTDSTSVSSDYHNSGPSRIKSALSTISSESSNYLEPPDPDLRKEQMLLSSEEAMLDQRKRDRSILAKRAGRRLPKLSSKGGQRKKVSGRTSQNEDLKTIIKTGDLAVDNHCLPSTLGGENAELVDKFRQAKLQEYNEICKLCSQNNVPFTEELLKKVLLFPPDKPNSVLKKNLRQPGSLSSTDNFPTTSTSHTFPSRQRKTSPTHKKSSLGGNPRYTDHSGVKMEEASSSGDDDNAGANVGSRRNILGQARNKTTTMRQRKQKSIKQRQQIYPMQSSVKPNRSKVNLSTGQAVIESKVDCWMTFEDYDHYTSKLEKKYSTLYQTTDYNAFWPGQLLDKVRLCMPETQPKSSSMFTSVQRERQIYPVNSAGLHTAAPSFIQYGLIGPPSNIYRR